MSFGALISSPLGQILLETHETGLTGLYFTDQRDCPRWPGLAATDQPIANPSDGQQDGRPARLLKAWRSAPSDTGPLFAADADQAASAGLPAAGQPSAAIQYLQDDTPPRAQAILTQARQELQEYWQGRRQAFDVSLAPQGSAFQKTVWQALLTVGYGFTLSYGGLAREAGFGPRHGRAVGTAVGSNPISIIIPCHRILAGNQTLNGYGGGLGRKIQLLRLEGFEIHA
ncbi:methylated-DNA--[protein]-cysteine S-methyltransferase [Castellaniella hirudinis]|uniref:methylated-DNA--[protein]-cysteine S-methyltransferase n=1 Tax=Castellaniella hirudinis TaxID=1144617 RepID=UPI0039C4CF02